MTAEEITKLLAEFIKNSDIEGVELFEHELMGSILYDPIRLQQKTSIALMQETEDGPRKRFSITVEDMVGLEDV